MITAAKIQNDIARIEALMMLGSKRERSLLSSLRQDCFYALDLIGQLSDDVYDKQHELAMNKLNNYEVAMTQIRQWYLKSQITEPRKKELEKEVNSYYKADRLRHQIRFLNYILGHADIIPPELLVDNKAMSQTEQYHAKQKGSR